MKRTTLDIIHVRRSALAPHRGRIVAGPLTLSCAIGRAGITHAKREGDGASPVGRFRILGGFYRPDRLRRPRTLLPLRPLRPCDGWCDDPRDRRYNRPIRLPDPARHEEMWREDHVYDVVLDIAWNRGPIVRGRGSAIFLHLAKPGFSGTEGCVAIDPAAVRCLLARIGPRTLIAIG